MTSPKRPRLRERPRRLPPRMTIRRKRYPKARPKERRIAWPRLVREINRSCGAATPNLLVRPPAIESVASPFWRIAAILAVLVTGRGIRPFQTSRISASRRRALSRRSRRVSDFSGIIRDDRDQQKLLSMTSARTGQVKALILRINSAPAEPQLVENRCLRPSAALC